MLLTILKSKIHRAKVTQADLNYVGSITIDEELLRQSGINEYEQVDVVDINNGNRLQSLDMSRNVIIMKEYPSERMIRCYPLDLYVRYQ